MTVKNCDRHSRNFISNKGGTRFYDLWDVHKDVAYYSSELAAVQESLKRCLDQEVNGSTGEKIPAEAQTYLAEANKLQKEMQSLEASILTKRRISWGFNSVRRWHLRKLAERHIDATRLKLRAFSALCGGALSDLGKPQKFEALKTVGEGGRRIIDLFQKRKLNLVGVVGPEDVGKMAVVREVELLIGRDEKFLHHVVWVDLGFCCDSIEKAQKKIGSPLEEQQFSGLDNPSALELLESVNVREEILIRAKVLKRHGKASTLDEAAEKLLERLKVTKEDLIRAGQLMRKLIALGPTLVILNDVWFSLEYLELVGIPIRKDCRVMVVSHSREIVFKEMKCQAIVELQELAQTAKKPLSVLKNIEMGIVRNIKGYHDFTQVSEHLTQDAKSILFLCCLFPPDHRIATEELARFAVVAKKILHADDALSFQDARKRIPEIATELSDSHLLRLSHEKEQQLVLMMPDAVHNCARRMICRKYPGRLLAASGDIDQTFLEKLDHSLCLLTLRGNIQSLQGIQSLDNLGALHMEHCKLLNSNNGNPDLIKLIGQLTQLEILSFRGSDIQHLPMELGGLKNLKLLDLSDCTDLQRIPEHLIPNWRKLEELYIGDFKNWSEFEPLVSGSASIKEVVDLPCLDTLFLTARSSQLPNSFSFPGKLQKYQIVIHGSTNHTEVVGYKANDPILKNSSSAISISLFSVQPLCGKLLDKVEYLKLKDISGLRSIIKDWSLPALNFLVIEDCRDLEYLVDVNSTSVLSNLQHLELINLEKFWCLVEGSCGLDLQHLETLIIKGHVDIKEEQLHIQLPKLQTIELKNLSKLTRILAMPIPCVEDELQTSEQKNLLKHIRIVARGISSIAMPNLRKLRVEDCPNLESSDVILPLTQAQEMRAACLETLILGGEFRKRVEKPGDLSIGNFTPFKFQPAYLYTNLKILELRGLPLEQLWKEQNQTIGLQTLTDLTVIGCKELRCIFTATICRNVPQLGTLKISGCHKLEQIIEEDEIFSSSDPQRISCFPNLTNLEVSGCPKLTTIFPISITHLPKLKTLSIKSSENITCVFQAKCIPDGTSKEQTLQLPQLQEVKLNGLKTLEAFTPQGFEFTLPSLKTHEVKDCPLIGESFRRLKGVRHEGSASHAVSTGGPQPSNHTSDFTIQIISFFIVLIILIIQVWSFVWPNFND